MITNSWIKYVDRTFLQIKDSVLNRLKTNVPELTDTQASNLLVIIVDMFAGVAELINYYIDTTARELYVPTARRFSSVLKLAENAGYLGKARVPAQAAVIFSLASEDVSPAEFIIPEGTQFTSIGGLVWVLRHNVEFKKGYYTAQGFVVQYEPVSDVSMGSSDGSCYQEFLLPRDYGHDSLDVLVGATPWKRVDSLGFSGPSSEDFIVKLKANGKVYLAFGDGVNGKIPTNASLITISYRSTEGLIGRIGPGRITTISSDLSAVVPSGETLLVTNPNPAFAGKGIESIEDVRRNIPISMRTLDRAVTRQDYIDVASTAPGVRAAVLNFDCGLGVDLYIVPEGGGIPTAAFLTDVENFVKTKSIATIPVSCKPSGETRIKLSMKVTGRYRISKDIINLKIKRKLETLYNASLTRINQSVRTSDIIAAVDNLPEVDFLTLQYIYAMPFLRPSNLNSYLEYSIKVLPNNNTVSKWKLQWVASTSTFTVFREGGQVATGLGVGTHEGVGNRIDLTISSLPSSTDNGDYWLFTTYPYNKDIELTDFSTPTINPADILLDITEQYV